jgi:hypothetical protein
MKAPLELGCDPYHIRATGALPGYGGIKPSTRWTKEHSRLVHFAYVLLQYIRLL